MHQKRTFLFCLSLLSLTAASLKAGEQGQKAKSQYYTASLRLPYCITVTLNSHNPHNAKPVVPSPKTSSAITPAQQRAARYDRDMSTKPLSHLPPH